MYRSILLLLIVFSIACNPPHKEEGIVLSGRFLAEPLNYFYGLDIDPDNMIIKFYIPSKWNSTKEASEQIEYMDWAFSWPVPYIVENDRIVILAESSAKEKFDMQYLNGALVAGCEDLKKRFVGSNTVGFCKTQSIHFVQQP